MRNGSQAFLRGRVRMTCVLFRKMDLRVRRSFRDGLGGPSYKINQLVLTRCLSGPYAFSRGFLRFSMHSYALSMRFLCTFYAVPTHFRTPISFKHIPFSRGKRETSCPQKKFPTIAAWCSVEGPGAGRERAQRTRKSPGHGSGVLQHESHPCFIRVSSFNPRGSRLKAHGSPLPAPNFLKECHRVPKRATHAVFPRKTRGPRVTRRCQLVPNRCQTGATVCQLGAILCQADHAPTGGGVLTITNDKNGTWLKRRGRARAAPPSSSLPSSFLPSFLFNHPLAALADASALLFSSSRFPCGDGPLPPDRLVPWSLARAPGAPSMHSTSLFMPSPDCATQATCEGDNSESQNALPKCLLHNSLQRHR
jgi:hypothetical protein